MLLELELPRVLAPDLSSNCYSRACLQQTHLNCPPKGQAFICPLTPSCIAQGERCAPAAFLRSMSNLSGPLSRIEPLSSVPVVTIACPLRCHLVDRSEAQSKSRSGTPPPRGGRICLWRGPGVCPFPAVPHAKSHTSQPSSCPVSRGARSCISLRITRVIHIARTPREGSTSLLAIVYNWFAEPFADSERIASSYSKACMA